MAATKGMVIANENKSLFKETINVIELYMKFIEWSFFIFYVDCKSILYDITGHCVGFT